VWRSSRRGGLIWGVVFGLWVISTVKAFVSGYPTVTMRIQLAHSLQAFAMILGEPRHAETVAGFVTWRVSLVATTIGAIWGLLSSTSVLRGQEDAGQWEIVLSGPTTKRRATVEALVGLGGSFLVMFVATLAVTAASTKLPGVHFSGLGIILFTGALTAGAAMFIAIGAVTSQLSATRGQAATIAAIILGTCFVVRMIGDSRSSLGWLRWASPLGWVEELHPLYDVQPVALVAIGILIVVCAALAIWLSGTRDLGASILRSGDSGGSTRLLVGPISLALYLSRTAFVAWLVSVAIMAWVYGSLARSSATLLSSSPSIGAALGRLGVRQATEGYLGIVFLLIDVLITVIAAGQVAIIRDEEASGRLDNLLVRPVNRVAWLAGRFGVSAGLIVAASIGAGFFTWIGTQSQHLGIPLPKLLEAGLNIIAPGVFVLGIGLFVLGVRPRLCTVAAYGVVAWSFLIDLLGSLVKGADWLRKSSLYTHVALAPSSKPDWNAVAIILLIGFAAALIGALAFQRRDIEYT
jgi:ABC-2 type transport system permease protein